MIYGPKSPLVCPTATDHNDPKKRNWKEDQKAAGKIFKTNKTIKKWNNNRRFSIGRFI
jgi:hypothetical protein